jgi:hypothetical protein
VKIVTRALTVQEYRAKAALMGMWYGDKTNVYIEGEFGPERRYYDADTGEEISIEEVSRRMRQYHREIEQKPHKPLLSDISKF